MSDSARVLLLEGKNSQFGKLSAVFKKAALSVELFKEPEALLAHVSKVPPSLVIMDLQFKEKDAIDILQEISYRGARDEYTIVVLGDDSQRFVEVAVLNAGADDYLCKPVNKRIFASRLNAWMRKQAVVDKALGRDVGQQEFNLDRERYSLIIRNEQVNLQRKEFEIISLLASRPKKVFSRKEIKEMVWGDSSKVRNRTIDVHVTNLRSKIGANFIRTYKGVGYSFDG